MKKIKLKVTVLTLAMCCLLMASTAVSVFAFPGLNSADRILAWNGANNACLVSRGTNATLQAVQNSGTLWRYENAPHGDKRLVAGNNCVNIYRILVGGAYYNATSYPYDNGTAGIDQRIVREGSTIRLASPKMGGTWYLVTDKSAPSSSSDVIWYTNPAGTRSLWV